MIMAKTFLLLITSLKYCSRRKKQGGVLAGYIGNKIASSKLSKFQKYFLLRMLLVSYSDISKIQAYMERKRIQGNKKRKEGLWKKHLPISPRYAT
jgi:hypothetical protein